MENLVARANLKIKSNINIPLDQIEAFCRKWKIKEFALFGSVLREDFSANSDIDVLISFEPDIPWSLYDWVDMIEELQVIFGREVDLVEKSGLKNPFRRHEILHNSQVIYAV
jgi:uncharacterized protein